MLNSDNELLLVENKLKNIVPKEVEFRAPKCNKKPKNNISRYITLKIDYLLLQMNYRLLFLVRLFK